MVSRSGISFRSVQQSPGDPGCFVGEGNNRPIEAAAGHQRFQPVCSPVVMLGQPGHDSASTVDQLAPEVVVGTSSDAAKPGLTTGSILPRYQSDPGCHLAARAKLSALVDGGDDRSSHDRTDPR